jgi:hypothetical protein
MRDVGQSFLKRRENVQLGFVTKEKDDLGLMGRQDSESTFVKKVGHRRTKIKKLLHARLSERNFRRTVFQRVGPRHPS